MAKYIKCSDRVHKLVKKRSAETGEEMQVIADAAISQYVETSDHLSVILPRFVEKGIDSETRNPYRKGTLFLHDKLEELLNGEDRQLIEVFFDRLKPATKRKAGGK